MRVQPSVLPDVDVAATGRNLSYSRVTIHAGIVGPCDPLTSGIVTSADPASVKLRRRIQNMVASS